MATVVGNASGQLEADTSTTDLTLGGEGRSPTGAVVFCTTATAQNTNTDDSALSVGFTDFTNSYAGGNTAEDAQGTTDTASESITGSVLLVLDPGTHAVNRNCTVAAISGGIRLTPAQSGTQYQVYAILIFGAECKAFELLDGIGADSTDAVAHGLSGKPNFGWSYYVAADFATGVNNARAQMGVFEDDGTITQKSAGVIFQHNQIDGEAHGRVVTDRFNFTINVGSGSVAAGAEITGNDATNFTLTARVATWAAPLMGLLVYASDVTAEVHSVDSPTTAASDWNFNSSSVTGQHLTLINTMIQTEGSDVTDSADAGSFGVFATDGTNEFSACVADENAADPSNTASRLSADLHLLADDQTDAFEMGSFSFTSDGWDVTSANITTANGTTRKWLALLLSEAAAGGIVPQAMHHYRNHGKVF